MRTPFAISVRFLTSGSIISRLAFLFRITWLNCLICSYFIELEHCISRLTPPCKGALQRVTRRLHLLDLNIGFTDLILANQVNRLHGGILHTVEVVLLLVEVHHRPPPRVDQTPQAYSDSQFLRELFKHRTGNCHILSVIRPHVSQKTDDSLQ